MTFGPDGALYILDYGETWGVNKNAQLLRISYQWGDLPPVAKASATTTAGPSPLTTTLSATGSFSPEKKDLTYQWSLLPKNTLLGKGQTIETTLTEPGNHLVRLTVRDSAGATSTTDLPLTVGNTPPSITALKPAAHSLFTPGQKIAYSFRVTDAEEGSSDDQPANFDARALVTAQWIGRDGRKIEANPGLSLMKQSDCFNCHAVEKKLIGPSFIEIANLYRGKKGAKLTATERVVKGSAGVWSEVPMLPHPQHSMDEAHLMVSWIFDLDPKKPITTMQRGLSGEITAPDDPNIGSALIEATFTDSGKSPANPLTTSKTITLRHHRIEAESATLHGPTLASQREASNDQAVNRIEPGRSISFDNLDLTGSTKVIVHAASNHAPGSTIELRSGTKDGPLLATIEIKKTGNNKTYQTFTAPLTPPAQKAPLHLLFKSPKKGRLMFLDWIEFSR